MFFKLMVMETLIYISNSRHLKTTKSSLVDKLFSDSDFCDVTLIGDDNKHVSAHRAVLSLTSKFLRCMLYTSLQQGMVNINIKASSDVIQALVQYMYLGHCKLEKCEEDQFFFLAEKWGFELAHQPNLKSGKLNKSSKAENKLVQSNELGSNQSKKIKTKKKRIIHKKCNTCNSIVLDIKSHMKDVHNKVRPPLSCSSKDCKHIVKSG